MTIKSDSQKSSPGNEVVLFDVDATAIGGGVHYFTCGTDGNQPIVWRGNAYLPRNIKGEGYEVSGEGAFPRPKITVSHINTALLAVALGNDDLIGAKVTRWRTFEHFLDGKGQADPNSHFAQDVHFIDRMVDHDDVTIQWELVAAIDLAGKKVPARQVLRRCTSIYRHWTGTAFDYSKATCPYAGASCFDASGNPATAELDRCGKRKSDCKLRYANQPLPYGGFLGVARVRQ